MKIEWENKGSTQKPHYAYQKKSNNTTKYPC